MVLPEDMTTGKSLERSAARYPDKDAIIAGSCRLTYAQLNLVANRVANALIDKISQKGVHVGIISKNSAKYGVVFFGSAKAGTVLTNISVRYSAEELEYVINKADVEILFHEDWLADRIEAIKGSLAKVREYVVLDEDDDIDDLLAWCKDYPDAAPQVEICFDAPFCMTYTGGTTGRPKGVLASHRNRYITSHTVVVEEHLEARDVIGIMTPMFHVAALNIMFQPAVLVGATAVIMRDWSVEGFYELVRGNGMTAGFMVPTQLTMLVNDERLMGWRDELKTWRKISFAGAPMPDPTQRALLKFFPGLRLTQIYGQSEMGVLTALPHWEVGQWLGAVGRPAYNVDVAIVDDHGIPVKRGVWGHLASRGSNLMLEYYNEPEQTSQIWRDEWAITGDVGYENEDGVIYLVDRAKDMLISGGENIYPKEIEDVLYKIHEIYECAVIGIPDDKWGEVPIAFVNLKEGMSLTLEQMRDHCEKHLGHFKIPVALILVQEFEKTPIGKIKKDILREPYWREKAKRI